MFTSVSIETPQVAPRVPIAGRIYRGINFKGQPLSFVFIDPNDNDYVYVTKLTQFINDKTGPIYITDEVSPDYVTYPQTDDSLFIFLSGSDIDINGRNDQGTFETLLNHPETNRMLLTEYQTTHDSVLRHVIPDSKFEYPIYNKLYLRLVQTYKIGTTNYRNYLGTLPVTDYISVAKHEREVKEFMDHVRVRTLHGINDTGVATILETTEDDGVTYRHVGLTLTMQRVPIATHATTVNNAWTDRSRVIKVTQGITTEDVTVSEIVVSGSESNPTYSEGIPKPYAVSLPLSEVVDHISYNLGNREMTIDSASPVPATLQPDVIYTGESGKLIFLSPKDMSSVLTMDTPTGFDTHAGGIVII